MSTPPATSLVAGDLLGVYRYGIVRESLEISGWVALWRPLEIVRYDWWPIRAEARLRERLAAMTVRIPQDRQEPEGSAPGTAGRALDMPSARNL